MASIVLFTTEGTRKKSMHCLCPIIFASYHTILRRPTTANTAAVTGHFPAANTVNIISSIKRQGKEADLALLSFGTCPVLQRIGRSLVGGGNDTAGLLPRIRHFCSCTARPFREDRGLRRAASSGSLSALFGVQCYHTMLSYHSAVAPIAQIDEHDRDDEDDVIVVCTERERVAGWFTVRK